MNKRDNKFESARAGRFIRVRHELITVALDNRPLWMMLVPVADNDGMVFLDRHHKKFDDLVLKTSGGSTEHPWSGGKWVFEGQLYQERMIPVVFLATAGQADRIAAFACKHYDQTEILYYPISDRVRRCRRSQKVSGNSRGTSRPKSRPRTSADTIAAAQREQTSLVKSSGEPSKAQDLPPVRKAARPSSEGASSPDSIHEEGRR